MKNLLIVVTSLQAAGAEKYAYELSRTLDRKKFNVEILTTDDVFRNIEFPHIYYEKIIKLGIKVHTCLFKPKDKVFLNNYVSKLPVIKYALYRYNRYLQNNGYKKKMTKLFDKQDIVILIDAPQLILIKDYIKPTSYLETHLMCHQSQFKNSLKIYKDFDPLQKYNFVYIDDLQLIEAKEQNVTIGNVFKLPLSIELNEEIKIIDKSEVSTSFNIGVFTRISFNKPINNIIKAFKELSYLNPKYKLYIFGFIQDEAYFLKLQNLIKKYDLEDKIFFEGHSSDMYKSCIKYNIILVWVISIYDFIGYAALEICLKNVPIVLSNIDDNEKNKPIDNESSIPPYFYNTNKLAVYTNYLIENNLLNELRTKEKEKCLLECDLIKNVSNYEKHLLNVTKN